MYLAEPSNPNQALDQEKRTLYESGRINGRPIESNSYTTTKVLMEAIGKVQFQL